MRLTRIRVGRFRVRRKAVAGGTISIAMTMMDPTASKAATVVIATMVMRR